MKEVFIHWKLDRSKECCLNRSWIDEGILNQLDAGLMKEVSRQEI